MHVRPVRGGQILQRDDPAPVCACAAVVFGAAVCFEVVIGAVVTCMAVASLLVVCAVVVCTVVTGAVVTGADGKPAGIGAAVNDGSASFTVVEVMSFQGWNQYSPRDVATTTIAAAVTRMLRLQGQLLCSM